MAWPPKKTQTSPEVLAEIILNATYGELTAIGTAIHNALAADTTLSPAAVTEALHKWARGTIAPSPTPTLENLTSMFSPAKSPA